MKGAAYNSVDIGLKMIETLLLPYAGWGIAWIGRCRFFDSGNTLCRIAAGSDGPGRTFGGLDMGRGCFRNSAGMAVFQGTRCRN